MTDQRELDRILGAFFVNGTDELADRVIDDALAQIDHTHQRHALRLPRKLETLPLYTRLAVAAVIGVLAVGGTFFLIQREQPAAGGPDFTPAPGASAGVPTSAPTPTSTPVPILTAKPSPMSLTGALGVGRQIHTATVLADGRILVAGGFDYADIALASASVFDPTTATFKPTGSLARARGLDTATLLADGRVLVSGGGDAGWVHPGPYLASAELYDPASGTFSPTGSLTTTRTVHSATLLADGRVLVIGGNEATDQPTVSAELYDPATGTFSPTGSMAAARALHSATLLADGRVLVTGGAQDAWTYSKAFLNSAEVYDPQSGRFSPTGSMEFPRAGHTATLLSDGRVLVAGGGSTASGGFTSAELYDPATGTFSATGSMADARIYHAATLLSDGRVLVTGGGGNYVTRAFLASAELYDPANGTFSATGSMTDTRTYHAATLLTDGRVLVTGGFGAIAPLASAELYDPQTGTFSPAGAGD